MANRFRHWRLIPVVADTAGMSRRSLPLILALLATGCAPDKGRGIVDTDVTYKVPAIKEAVDRDDKSSAPNLVAGLNSEDPAIRFYSIVGLRRLTGQTFEYHYYDAPPNRRPAIQRWKQWLAEQKA